MIKNCMHEHLEYLDCGDGVIDWTCLDCGEVIEQFEDCKSGR
jgi:hypothetical protein